MSKPTPEQWSAMTKLVQSFFQKPDAEPFREPVDWQNMGLFDYPKVIKKPMDLGRVKRTIVDRKYDSLQDAAEDVGLVWKNCMTYNADGSDFFILAQTLNKKWQEKFKKLLDELRVKDPTIGMSSAGGAGGSMDTAGGGSNNNNKLTLDEKRAFAKSLYKISKDELGRVLVEIEKNCPAALTRNSSEDEIEFNVDRLPAGLLSDLQAYVKSCTSGGAAKIKKKSSSGGGGASKRQKS